MLPVPPQVRGVLLGGPAREGGRPADRHSGAASGDAAGEQQRVGRLLGVRLRSAHGLLHFGVVEGLSSGPAREAPWPFLGFVF